MYITIEELKTHAYDEELQAIIRQDETIALASIDMAEEFAESKLSKTYDTEIIFSKTGTDRSALLMGFIKDIAIWKLIGLANPSIDYEDKKFRYQEAVNWLTAVYKGMPANFPKLPESSENQAHSHYTVTQNAKTTTNEKYKYNRFYNRKTGGQKYWSENLKS